MTVATNLRADADQPRAISPPLGDAIRTFLVRSRRTDSQLAIDGPDLDGEVVTALVDRLGRRVDAERAAREASVGRGLERELGLEVERERHSRVPTGVEDSFSSPAELLGVYVSKW